MFHEFLLASQSVQALGTLLNAAHGLANYNEIMLAVSDVNSKLMQANNVALASQEKQSDLAAKVQELEKECMRLKDWSAEKERYELKEIGYGVYAYIEKNCASILRSAHKFCANCFEQNLKSILQRGENRTPHTLDCHRCKSKLTLRSYIDEKQ